LFETSISPRTTGDEFQKPKRGFFPKQADIKKNPPYFTHLSQSGRIEDFLGPYFSKLREGNKSKGIDGKDERTVNKFH
jgi:hypothetical protein